MLPTDITRLRHSCSDVMNGPQFFVYPRSVPAKTVSTKSKIKPKICVCLYSKKGRTNWAKNRNVLSISFKFIPFLLHTHKGMSFWFKIPSHFGRD